MRLWLSRQGNGDYMLTAFEPVRAIVKGTDKEDLYLRTGEPIGVRHLCPDGVKSLFDVAIEVLESVRVNLTSETVNAEEELRGT